MSVMKKIFLFIALIVFLSAAAPFSHPLSASAEDAPQYAVADARNVWFYAEPDEESGLFILPYTYYVLVLAEGTAFCAVRYLDDAAPYKSVTGYCKTEELTFVDFIPERPWLRKQITATYSLAGTAGVALGNGSFNTVEKTFLYYGTSYSGTARFYYVLCDGVFDYIPAAEEIAYDLNVDYLTVPAAPPAEEPSEERSSPSALQIAVVCITVAAVCAVAAFVLRGKKAPAPQDDF